MSRTVVITGSASGIGKATADMARTQGYTVVGVDLKDAEVTADLSTPAGRQAAVEATVDKAAGTIDAVVACAGISAPIAKTVAINYFGAVDFLEGLRPTLAKSDAPRAAVVSSMATLHPSSPELVDAMLAHDEAKALEIGGQLEAQGPEVGYANYSGSKRALSRWVRRASISDAWAGAHIPLNAVAPGTVLTPMTKDLLKTEESVKFVDSQVPMPLNYHQPPESVANLLMFLISEANTHMAGQTIYCDGGADASLRGDDIWSWNDK